MNEFDFIDQLRRQTQSRKHSTRVINGIGDDASVISEVGNRDLVVTTDLLVEDIDFIRNATPPRLLGHKALAVSLSDIASMGARPFWSFLSIGMPRETWNDNFKDDFIEGFFALADQFGVTLAGGDVSETRQGVVIDSIVLGEVASGAAILRSGAQPGDQVYVTGTLGGAAAGLKLIQKGARVKQESGVGSWGSGVGGQESGGSMSVPRAVATGSVPPANSPIPLGELGARARSLAGGPNASDDDAIQSLLLRQLQPSPRVGWGIVLGDESLASAMIDLSDGLSSDLNHLCKESNVGALINSSSIPLDEAVKHLCGRRALDPLALALHGGEDFELLFTVDPENVSRLPKRVDGIAISHIGEITATSGSIHIREKDHVWDLHPQGFEHFR